MKKTTELDNVIHTLKLIRTKLVENKDNAYLVDELDSIISQLDQIELSRNEGNDWHEVVLTAAKLLCILKDLFK